MLGEFKKPDLKAPRYRPNSINILNRQLFKKFIEKYPEYKNKDYEEFKRNINSFNEALWMSTIENRNGVELPENLGNIFIATCWKTKRKNIDFGKSTKYGKELSNHNHETDGKNCKIFYTNYENKYRFTNRILWTFQGCRDYKRMVAKTYPQNWKMYIHIDPNSKINKLYKKRMRRQYMQKNERAMLDYYNEFDMD